MRRVSASNQLNKPRWKATILRSPHFVSILLHILEHRCQIAQSSLRSTWRWDIGQVCDALLPLQKSLTFDHRSVESMARQPEAAGQISTAMIITAALIEGATLFALVITLLAVL